MYFFCFYLIKFNVEVNIRSWHHFELFVLKQRVADKGNENGKKLNQQHSEIMQTFNSFTNTKHLS